VQSREKNTPPNRICSKCGKEAHIRKDKPTFHRKCQGCGHTEVYHVNIE
jgi:predicted nucleic-acid-binding Zn-ribbon protein